MDEAARLTAVIGELYDAALDPALWGDRARDGVRDFVGGASAGIVAKDATANRGFVCFDDGSIAPDYTAVLFRPLRDARPCTTGHFFSTPDAPVSTADLIPYDEFQETRFYREWARPQGFIDYMGAAIDKSATTAVVFNVMRHESDGMFDEASRRRMRLIAPHVRRAVVIGNAIDLKTAEAASLAEVFDGLSTGDIPHRRPRSHRPRQYRRPRPPRRRRRALRLGRPARGATSREPTADPRSGSCGGREGRRGDRRRRHRPADSRRARDGEPYAAHVLPLTSGSRREAGSSYRRGRRALRPQGCDSDLARSPSASRGTTG